MLHKRNIITLLAGTMLVGAISIPALAQERVQAVATFSIIGDLVGQIGGERVDVTTLVGPDGDGHVYSPSPADARRLAEGDVVFTNGLLYEGWIDRLIASSGTQAPVVVVAENIDAIPDGGHGDAHDDHDHGHDHDDHDHSHDDHGHEHDDHGHEHDDHGHSHDDHLHGEFDPHAWQDVGNVKVYVANIRDALIAHDPAGSDIYSANAETYIGELAALDA